MKLPIDDLGNVGILVEDWELGREYKPRTLTTDYSTWITYISRKAVPAGTPITDITYWKPIARLKKDIAFDYNSFKDEVNVSLSDFLKVINGYEKEIDDLKLIINSFLATSGGAAFDNKLGDGEYIGINQKTLTNIIKAIYSILEEVSGKSLSDVNISISHNTQIKHKNPKTNIIVTSEFPLIDYVTVLFNGQEAMEKEGITSFDEIIPLTETTKIDVEVSVLGKITRKSETVIVMSDFFVGAGEDISDIMDPKWSRDYDGNPQGQYSVDVVEGDRIIVMILTSEANKIEQIEMNDFNIPMKISTYGDYTIYKSINKYKAGTYLIDINY